MSNEMTSSQSSRHQSLSRWHSSPNWRHLCRDRCLARLRQIRETRSLLVDKMRKINLNDINSNHFDDTNQSHEDFVDEDLQQIISSDVDMSSFTEQELHEFTQEVKQEFLDEQSKYWEGLQTKEDQQKSQKFLFALQSRHVLICPYCKLYEMQTINGYLICTNCNIRFETRLSIDEIIGRIYGILNVHSMSECKDPYPQYNMFNSNLIIYCDTCPLNQFVL